MGTGQIEPLAAILLAFFLLSESPSLFALFGGLLIILSGYLVVHARMHYEKRALN